MKPQDVERLTTLADAARRVRLGRSTVQAAYARGELGPYRLADGTPVVAVVDVERWGANRPKRGRPRKPTAPRRGG